MDSNSDDNNNIIDNLAFRIDEHLRGIQIGLCAAAIIAVGYAVKSIEPFTKFSHIHHIPPSFIEKNIKLNGRVVGVKPILPLINHPSIDAPPHPSNVTILVDHQPIFKRPFAPPPDPSDPLTICLDSVAVSEQGLETLHEALHNRPVSFVLLSTCEQDLLRDAVSCIVYCQLPHTNRWHRLASRHTNVAHHLVRTGGASVTPSNVQLTHSNPLYRAYYQELLQLEGEAEKSQLGIWAPVLAKETPQPEEEEHVSVWTKLGRVFKWKS